MPGFLCPAMIDRHLRSYNRLQYQLTLSYAVVTVLVTLALETCQLTFYELGVLNNLQNTLPARLETLAPGLARYLAGGAADSAQMQTWLEVLEQEDAMGQGSSAAGQASEVFHCVLDPAGRVVASAGAASLAPADEVDRRIQANALAGKANGARRSLEPGSWSLAAAAPVIGPGGQVLGALFTKTVYEDNRLQIASVQPLVLPGLLFAAAVAGLAAILSGYLNARALTRRLAVLAERADEWSRGDFNVRIEDRSADELGDLARHFNSMAGQINGLVSARQELAALEERNRIAHDLHDSVKQEVFALAMLLSAARSLSATSPDLATARLADAEGLTHQVQGELELLIQQLRPGSRDAQPGATGGGPATDLNATLREHAAAWARQQGIPVELRLEDAGAIDGQPASPALRQALFRVAQEALANTARHARATAVTISLRFVDGAVTLSICDNGVGFDIAAHAAGGLGLASMRERVEGVGGSLALRTAPGQGTRITATCPLETRT
jgi:NarL family two-component system sensor histidine kinase LiaS